MLNGRRFRERGTVLLLFPASMLVMVVLGALVIDAGYVHLRGRELQAVADSAANDSLAALDVDALRAGRGLVIEERTAAGIVEEAIGAGPLPSADIVEIVVTAEAPGRPAEIAVTLRLEIDLVMAPAVGDLDRVALTRTGRAVILRSS